MDTNQAIATLQSLQTTIRSSIADLQGQDDALTVAISQLQGTLTTQLTELEAVKVQLQEASPAAAMAPAA